MIGRTLGNYRIVEQIGMGSGNLVKMRVNGAGPTTIWDVKGQLNVFVPQWSPDGQWIAVSMLPSDDSTFPMVRKIYVVSSSGYYEGDSPGGGNLFQPAVIIYQDDRCLHYEVAFSPDGQLIAYVDDDCGPRFKPAGIISENYPDSVELPKEFPSWWTGSVYPQWGDLDKE